LKIKLETLLADDKNEIWFEDESDFEKIAGTNRAEISSDSWKRYQLSIGKLWNRGKKSKLTYEGLHIRQNILGAVCPNTGEFISLIFDYCDTKSFQALLDEIAKQTFKRSKSKKIILILEVLWHKTKSLNWHHIIPEYSPTYSPDFNPIERLWLRMKEIFSQTTLLKLQKI